MRSHWSLLQQVQFSSVQLLSRVPLFGTPWISACQASLSITNSWSSLRLTSIESVMPSSHLILCHPLLLLPPILPSIRVFSNESTLRVRWPKYSRLDEIKFVFLNRNSGSIVEDKFGVDAELGEKGSKRFCSINIFQVWNEEVDQAVKKWQVFKQPLLDKWWTWKFIGCGGWKKGT